MLGYATNIDPDSDHELSHRRIGTVTLVFIIIAASAPLTVLAGGVPTNFAVSGLLGVPVGYLILGILLAIFAVGFGAMGAYIRDAGAFFAYIREGLGERHGTAAAMLALVSYNMMQIGLFGMFGFAMSSELSTWFGFSVPWWAAGALGWIIVAALGINSIDFSAKILGILVVLEFLVVAWVCINGLTSAPEGLSTQSLRISDFAKPGVGVLLAFSIAAFMGFESGAIYSEETINPVQTVPKATYIAICIIGLFYAFSAWLLAMGIGPSEIIAQSQEKGPNLVFEWMAETNPFLARVASLLFATSLLAALIAFHNAAARYFFALGRARILPYWLSGTSTAGAPRSGSITQSFLGLCVVALFAIAGRGSSLGELYPVITLFTWLTNAAAFGLVFLTMITSFAVYRWFRRDTHGHSFLVTALCPLISFLGLAVVAVLILLNFDEMIGKENPQELVVIMPGIILLSGIVGYLLTLRKK